MRSQYLSSSEAETIAAGRVIASGLTSDAVVFLSGDLGAGKTVLTRGLAEGLGIDPHEIQSPTFTLIREHHGPHGTLLHADLYRLEPEQVGALGLEELLFGPGIKVIEWAERLPFDVPGAVRVEIRRAGSGDSTRREIWVEQSA